jgi:DNA-binding CsgD family transcriptional regulator
MGSSIWLETGSTALAGGDWPAARNAFEAALAEKETGDALDGLARSMWWLGEPDEALALRERAFRALRKTDPNRAVRNALWLAGEYEVAGNIPAASGWVARAERLLEDMPEGVEHGWLALARARQMPQSPRAEQFAREALTIAERYGDSDLEIRSLARIGLILITSGRVDEGIKHLDEAMAAATAGEGRTLETVGETCFDLVLALEIVGDFQRFARWNEVVMGFMHRHAYGPLVAFCGTCCGELFAAAGDIEGAEGELNRALRTLQEKGQSFRCAHPAAKLAEIRVLQGRFEEAERLLSAYPNHPAVLRAQVELSLARSEHRLAISLLQRHLERLPQNTLLSVPYLARLVNAGLRGGNRSVAREANDSLQDIARSTEDPRAVAEAKLAEARVGISEGRPEGRTDLETAIAMFQDLRLALEAARARLLLAQTLGDNEPELAALEARAALRSLEASGADREADEAAALLRVLDGSGRAGPKQYSGLTKRELEVLDLLGEGLTNSEIADRLFISTKTAGHHVSNVLMKLHLRSRTEAALYALRQTHEGAIEPQKSRAARI